MDKHITIEQFNDLSEASKSILLGYYYAAKNPKPSGVNFWDTRRLIEFLQTQGMIKALEEPNPIPRWIDLNTGEILQTTTQNKWFDLLWQKMKAVLSEMETA